MRANIKARAAALALLLGAGASVPALADGKAVYEKTCVACHGADGKGVLPGVPNFTEPGGPLSKPQDHLVISILEGFQSDGSPMAMPAKGGNADLTEADAKAVLDYLLSAFKSQ